MQGMLFLVIDRKTGAITNKGIIAQQITPEAYLCQMHEPPVHARVVTLAEIHSFALFTNQSQLDAFITSVKGNPNPVANPVAKAVASKKKTKRAQKKK